MIKFTDLRIQYCCEPWNGSWKMKEVYAQVTGWTCAQRCLRHSLWKYIEEPQSNSRCRVTHTGNYVLEEKGGGVRYEMDLENYWHKKDKPLDFPENHQAFVLLVFLCTICWRMCFPPQQEQLHTERACCGKFFSPVGSSEYHLRKSWSKMKRHFSSEPIQPTKQLNPWSTRTPKPQWRRHYS